MASDSFDYAVIGAGIVGLATARELLRRQPSSRVAIVEKETEVALHQSGRNSGVIHAGLYYTPGSLRARLCREGRESLVRFAEEHEIPYRLSGKLVVATHDGELSRLQALYERGKANGLQGLRLVNAAEAREIEPSVEARRALHVPETGVIDFREVARALATEVAEAGGTILLERDVRAVHASSESVTLEATAGDVRARAVIACSGAGADRIARLAGIDTRELRIIPFRGSFHSLVPDRRELVGSLIYPVPNPSLPFLGVHFTRRIDGEVVIGPNAVLALARDRYGRKAFCLDDVRSTLGYRGFWQLARRHWRYGAREVGHDIVTPLLVRELRRYIPSIVEADVRRAGGGTRAQLVRRDGAMEDDFVVARSPRMLHVLNAPSPAATASLAIARLVLDEAAGFLDFGEPSRG
jgi:L-2-hydroxyglutarate oxidase LhgO